MATATGQATPYQALFRACMKEAAAQGRVLMQRLVARALDSLQRAAALAPTETERKLLGEAARTLTKHEPALGEAYPQALLAEFAHAIAGDTRKAATLSFDALELMGDEQVQDSVDQMRLQQQVMSHVELELTELNTLLCAVQGLKTMQAERSPLRPQVYVRSLRNVAQQSPVPAAVRHRWLQHMGEALGPELARVYADLSRMLVAQGVAPAGFNAGRNREMPGSGAVGTEGSPAVPQSTLLNLRELRRLLSGEFDASGSVATEAEAARGPEFSMTMPAAFETLQEMKQVDQVMERLKQRGASGDAAPGAQHELARLRAQARGPGQALALEVVDLMVEKIASDPRLLAPVQQTVRDLAPALLRLAMEDPRFFSDRKHPARRLLDEMTQRSLAWEAVEAPGFAAFIEPLQQAVEVLLATRIPGAEPFDFALRTLEEAWGEAQQRDRHHREKAVRALLQAEQRNLLAERIGKELRARPDVLTAPRELASFLTGPWCQVMAQARLADASGATDPGGYAGLVADLLWSAQQRMSVANAAKLAGASAAIIERVRHGLATIDYPAPATQRFVEQLKQLHQQAIRSAAEDESGRPKALSTSLSREELEALMGDDEGPGSWLAPTEAQHSGFMDTHQSQSPKPIFQETQPAFGETKPGAREPEVALPDSGLQPGAWVEMMIDAGWGRYQVTWASPHRTLFMFSNASGRQHSMTRRHLGKMMDMGALRLIADQTVVDGALDAVANEALRNSLDIPL